MIRQAPPTDRGTDWRDLGACATHPEPDLWFPVGSTGTALLEIKEAKAVCRACPVMATCQQWALNQREQHGVWGGLSERERLAIWRRRGYRPSRRKARAAA